MPGPYKKFLRLSDAAIMDNEQGAGFAIETHEGGTLRVFCSLDEIGDIFSFLGALAKEVSMQLQADSQGDGRPRNELAPIPAQGMGFQAGRSPDETLLVMNLYGFGLAFAVPSSGLAQVAEGFARTARTLSAGRGKPQ